MKLFFYYTFCSFKNQLKKIFKTWVLIFILVCMVMGGIIGFAADSIGDAFKENATADFSEEEIITKDPSEEEIITEEPLEDIKDPYMRLKVSELACSGILILLFFINFISGDKNGNSIFLPADVSVLFSSPLRPQSVLLFRLSTQMATSLFISIYLLFQVPNFVLNFGFTVSQALILIVIWFFSLIYSKLISVFIYTFSTTYIKFKKLIRPVAYTFVGVLALSFYIFHSANKTSLFDSAVSFFNFKASRYIPIYGWHKWLLVSVFENNIMGIVTSSLLLIFGAVVLVFIIWSIKADFYEDAMKKTEELAELLNAAQKNGVAVRKKERSEKLKRDGFDKGYGANTFFYISMYNRFRFAKFFIFTKTATTYLFTSICLSYSLKYIFEFESVLPVILAIGALAFYRSLGNPISRDLSNGIFLTCPENTYKKLFYSHMGGTANCALDLLLAIIFAQVFFSESILFSLISIVFILSIDIYSGSVGAFINASVPSGFSDTIKKLIQILFIYFGLFPVVIIIVLGFLFKMTTLFILLASAFSVFCAGIFFLLTGRILQKGKR